MRRWVGEPAGSKWIPGNYLRCFVLYRVLGCGCRKETRVSFTISVCEKWSALLCPSRQSFLWWAHHSSVPRHQFHAKFTCHRSSHKYKSTRGIHWLHFFSKWCNFATEFAVEYLGLSAAILCIAVLVWVAFPDTMLSAVSWSPASNFSKLFFSSTFLWLNFLQGLVHLFFRIFIAREKCFRHHYQWFVSGCEV